VINILLIVKLAPFRCLL